MKQLFLYFTIIIMSLSSYCQELKPKKLRDLSPDRPHQTESSITVDKGHLMLESDFVNFQNETSNGLTTNSIGLLYLNVKYGFHKNMDIEVLTGTFTHRGFSSSLVKPENLFFDDFLFRYKLNILGNDSGRFSVALMPVIYITNPFKKKFNVNEFGFLVNTDLELSEKCGLGYTGGLNSFSLDGKKNYELFSTMSFDYEVAGPLHHFIELSYRYNESATNLHTYSLDSGLTFTPKDNLQFDCGFYYFFPVNTLFAFVGGTIRL